MFIKEFYVANFKAFQEVHIHFNPCLNILTGVNNSGKTTLLEALALWHECFAKQIYQAKKAESNYKKGHWVLGNTQRKRIPFEQINSVRCPRFDDMFHQRDRRKRIQLTAVFEDDSKETLHIPFVISESGMNYNVELDQFTRYDFAKFNHFFQNLPNPVGFFYASPIAAIQQIEAFATQPQVAEAIVNRNSASVLRNRLYALYRHPDPAIFQRFLTDLSYIISDSKQPIQIFTESDIQRDTNVIFNVKLHAQDTDKDIALLGSGTLQILEILLNLYHSDGGSRDMNLILLDEPDSHIHRDIQNRLMAVLTNFSKRDKNQIFITTHNESLIRSADIADLFHLEAKPKGTYKNAGLAQLKKIGQRFSGIYPTPIRPIIGSLGSTNGLDFINAVEADVLIFVEGEDDARAFDILLRQQIRPKKYSYWVLGGISKVLDHIQHYKTVLSNVKNQKTLWEKSVLIIDRDFLNDAHQANLSTLLHTKLGLKTCLTSAYTFEATLLTDFAKLGRLVSKWLEAKSLHINDVALGDAIANAYQEHGSLKSAYWQSDKFIEETCYLYRNAKEKLNGLLGQKFIDASDIQLQTVVRAHIQHCVDTGQFFKLLRKEDVQIVLNNAIAPTGAVFNIETDFIELMYLVDKSVWFDAWDFLNAI